MPDKSKGTGVALYVHNSLTATVDDELCLISSNLETIFVIFSIGPKLITIGAVYRPPNGNLELFLAELRYILEKIPPNNTYIMGDFNADLHKLDIKNNRLFEELVITAGAFPLISLPTHCQPGSRKTCIDNILTNTIDDVLASGVIRESVSNHSFVYQLTNITHDHTMTEKNIQYYDFRQKNIGKFVDELDEILYFEQFDINCHLNFDAFLNMYTSQVDKFFKLETPKTTKRNKAVNP